MTLLRAVPALPLLAALTTLATATSCDTTDPCDRPPRIRTTTSPLIICQQQAEFRVDLLLENKGCDDLKIERAEFLGSDKDAFSAPEFAEGSDTIAPEGSGFLRFTYAPSGVGEDHVWLVIHSNADKFPRFRIPICGPGAVAGANATPCTESTQCADGLSCMRAQGNDIVVDCDPADGEDEGCFCQARQCMEACRCPPGLPADEPCVEDARPPREDDDTPAADEPGG